LDQFLSLSTADRALAFQQAEARLTLPAASIEKDFWVSFTLRALFSLPNWRDNLTFKGGTSLSKAWNLIQRFSEDIDLVIDRPFLGIEADAAPETAPSKKQQRKRVEGVKLRARTAIQDQLLPTLKRNFATNIPAVLDAAHPSGCVWRRSSQVEA
jgi:predicted nucleotidyltransferase component of viral defense system